MSTYNLTEDMLPSKVLYLDSKFATTRLSKNSQGDLISTDYIYNLKEPLICPDNMKILISLYNATIPFSFYNLREQINDRFYLSYILHDIFTLKKYDMFIPNIHPKNLDMDDDKFAIGNFNSTNQYSNILTNLEFLINTTGDLVSEKWLQLQLLSNNIKNQKHFINLDLIRKINLETYLNNNSFYNQ